jgi:hypothetical protein
MPLRGRSPKQSLLWWDGHLARHQATGNPAFCAGRPTDVPKVHPCRDESRAERGIPLLPTIPRGAG